MTADLIYVTVGETAAEVVSRLEAEKRDLGARIVAYLADFTEKFPQPDGEGRVFIQDQYSGAIIGMRRLPGEKAPTGLRDSESGDFLIWVPRSKTSMVGAEYAEDWAGLRVPTIESALRELGMPVGLFHGLSFLRPGADRYDGQVVVWWSDRSARDQIDGLIEKSGHADLWREMPRSEYYAWREAQESAVAS